MLGRKDYTQEEIDHGREAVTQQLAAYQQLAKAISASGGTVDIARESFEFLFFSNMVLALDRYFAHRLPGPNYEGKDGNPLNEVRIICDSLISNGGIMHSDKHIKLAPERSVLKLHPGDPIRLTGEQFTQLSAAFFTELERRFLKA